jgi:DNA-binding beta-propeller fold protein YncE
MPLQEFEFRGVLGECMKANLLISAVCLLVAFTLLVTCPTSAVTQTSASTQASAPEHSNIRVENWTQPQHGWLYILDPKPDAKAAGGAIWLIDPSAGKVMASIRTGESPDFALSPDGNRLYVASAVDADSSELAVIDTVRGEVLKSGMVNGRLGYDGIPPFSTMAVSGDGLALRILIDAPKSADEDALLLATFDTRAGEFLPGIVHLGNCGPGRFISYPTASRFDFLCPRTNRVRMISVDGDSRAIQNVDVKIPWERREGIGEAIELPGSQDMEIVRGDGGVFHLNSATQQFADTPVHPTLPNRVPPAAWPISPDGSRLYLGYKHDYDQHSDKRFYLDYGRPPNIRPNNATADEFRVIDTRTWRKVGTIRTKMPFWSAAMSSDGKMVYATAPQKHSVLVIDTARMKQVSVLKVGGAPALAIVAP